VSTLKVDEHGVIQPCPACGQKNRTPFERLNEIGTCGKCKQPLPSVSTPLAIEQEAHFDRLLSASPLPVLVDFWAAWCGPCRMVAPELEKIAETRAGQWLVAKVDTEALPRLAQRLSVQSLPTLAVFVGGREVGRTSGARPAAAIEDFVRQATKSS
jgi:thioredoxin 2